MKKQRFHTRKKLVKTKPMSGVTEEFRQTGREAVHSDVQGSYTGVPMDDPYEKPVQDADDL